MKYARKPRILLSTVFKPFSIESEYDAPGNLVEHGLVHRSFTRRQGMFTIDQQCVTYPLHLIAHNVSTGATVLEYPTLEEFAQEVGRGYDFVGVSCTASTLNKARRMCEVVKELSPRTQTIIGGAGAIALGKVMPPFSDHVCRGDGIRFIKQLVGDPPTKLRHPVSPTVHGVNRLLGLPAHDANFAVAVALGCLRRCEFCSTSHQFEGKYIPMFDTGAELFAHMQATEQHELSRGRRHSALGFVIYDENFLMNRRLVEEFRQLNREQLLRGTQYLCFVFSDAEVVSSYEPEQLLEIGVDSLWIGLESPSLGKYKKTQGVDVANLIRELSATGIKVFVSLIAGLEEHTERLIRDDMDLALSLPVTGVQYAPVDPLPGTPYYQRLEQQGMIPDRDLKYFSMSHYNLLHPSLSEEQVLCLIDEFYDREHEQNGPLVYRFLQGRWDGYRRGRRSQNPWVRARAEHFARDVLRGFPVLLLGECLGPSASSRERFSKLRRDVQRHFRWSRVFDDTISGKLGLRDGGVFLACSLPVVRSLVRWILSTHVLLRDPRVSLRQALFATAAARETAAHGMVPWTQPETVYTHYTGFPAESLQHLPLPVLTSQ